MDWRDYFRIGTNLLLFPVLYPKEKGYPTLARHFAVSDDLPEKADCVVALGCSLRPDGTAANPTRAIADRAAELYRQGRARKMVISGGNPVNGVTEGEAMMSVARERHGLSGPDLILDELPKDRYVGTLQQVQSVEKILRGLEAKKVLLVVQPQQLPRALWLFRRMIPDIAFYPANPAEEYDPLSTQSRMHTAWRFRIWNMIAWAGLWRHPGLRRPR